MRTANSLVRSIFGFSGSDIISLVRSAEIAYDLMFEQGRSRNSIMVTKDIYSVVVRSYREKSYSSVVWQIERLCNRCWARPQRNDALLMKIIGNKPSELEAASEIIFLLACYLRYRKSFQEVLEQEPALTF